MRPRLDPTLRASLFLAVLAAGAVYCAGRLGAPYAQRVANAELELLTANIAEAYLLEGTGVAPGGRSAAVDQMLARAVSHPRVALAMVRSPQHEVLAFARKPDASPAIPTHWVARPLVDRWGVSHGEVSLALLPETRAPEVPYRWRWAALAGGAFGFVFFGGYGFFHRKDGFLEQLIDGICRVNGGNIDVELPIPTNPEQAVAAHAFNGMLEGIRERDRMRHSLGRIMDPKIAEILIKENPKVGGRRRQATILFCDIRNYTSLCEQLDPDELQIFLNEYWKDTVEIIMEQEGTIDKFHGDGVCVVFGAPLLHEDDPLRAVRTAWRLVENVEKLNKRREAQRKTPIQIGVGVHTGEVIAGHIGSERRMDYTVVGDAVNVAARIEGLNKKYGTKILISDSVYEKVEANVRVKTLSLAYLRGRERPILIHALREFFETPEAFSSQQAA